MQNGIYTVTNIGGTTVNWVLTRAADFDSPSQMVRGKTIDVISGTVNALTSWMLGSRALQLSEQIALPLQDLQKWTRYRVRVQQIRLL